ncbi:MAG: TolC family protein [Phycisphaerales bacterium]|nr:MAG: TolC family protein [Phycisphaerales bacterium]
MTIMVCPYALILGALLWIDLFTSAPAAACGGDQPGAAPADSAPRPVLAAAAAQIGANGPQTPPPPDDHELFQRYDARLTQRLTADAHPTIPPDRLIHHVPDPERARREAMARLQAGTQSEQAFARRYLERLDSICRPTRVPLRLEDVIRRALAGSFAVEVQRYNPAIEATRVVEAQAAFDAVFFSSLTKQIQDRPTASQLTAADFDLFNLTSGVRQLLPTGMSVSAAWSMRRTSTSLAFQQLNPEYFSDFEVAFRQPLLRGFGLDYNLSAIRVSRNNRQISELQFEQQIRALLRDLEEAYWQLVVARRDLAITAHLLGEFEDVYQYLLARQEFDVTKIQLEDTRANLENSKVELLAKQNVVFNAEDRLIFLMNDPELNFIDDVELFPEDLPTIGHFELDRLGELQTALDGRSDIRESKLRVANARIGVGQAVNQALPRLDLAFTYTVDGLGPSADDAFDELTMHDFTEYTVGIELEVPIGNRAARSAEKRARLIESQARAALKQQIEQVIVDVNVSIRQLTTTYEQIGPRFESVEANERQVESILARAERKDFTQLNAELGARRSLAANRRALMQAIVDYNMAIIDLERAKGTLLPYNSVVIEPGP